MQRLYVLVRDDLPKTHQAVQAGHAVAAWCRAHAHWDNEVLVYLRCRFGERNLLEVAGELEDHGLPHVVFREPDRRDEATALAISHPKAVELFRGFALLDLGA